WILTVLECIPLRSNIGCIGQSAKSHIPDRYNGNRRAAGDIYYIPLRIHWISTKLSNLEPFSLDNIYVCLCSVSV
ncbi:hypothetical protein PRIPAC_87145, partial [Pristionchus pacificus]